MKQEITFGHWSPNIHTTPDQKKRIESAKQKETTPTSIDNENQTGEFPSTGKSPYRTSLDLCTCKDFSLRKQPCKHIYRLALALGLLEGTFEVGLNKNQSLGIETIVAILESYSDDTQKRISEKLRLFNKPNNQEVKLTILRSEESVELQSCPFFIFSPLSIKEKMEIIRMMDLKLILQGQGVEYPKVRKKAELIEFCLECDLDWSNLLPDYCVISLREEFKKKARQTRTYLRRKYEWEEDYSDNMRLIKHPAGSKTPDIIVTRKNGTGDYVQYRDQNLYFFPDDVVTELLTFYGHNRCKDGFYPEEIDEE